MVAILLYLSFWLIIGVLLCFSRRKQAGVGDIGGVLEIVEYSFNFLFIIIAYNQFIFMSFNILI